MIFCKRSLIGSIVLIFMLILGACSAFASTTYTKKEIVENSQTCLMCHDTKAKSLANSPHRILEDAGMKNSSEVGCISCHDGWKEHIDDPSADNISSVSELDMTEQSEVCSRCHVTAHQSAMVTKDVHGLAGLECTSCHKIHDNPNPKLTAGDGDNFCVTCHTEIKAKFMLRSAHPLHSGNIKCVSCHPVSGIEGPEMVKGLNWTCQGCHGDKAGPFPFEHPVVYSHLVEGGGCVECHQPHGSPNDMLLKQPGNGLCLQCHSIPPKHRTQHSGLGTKLACVDCHSEIHGSYDNNKFLDPMLGTKLFPNCYQSGCHIFNR